MNDIDEQEGQFEAQGSGLCLCRICSWLAWPDELPR